MTHRDRDRDKATVLRLGARRTKPDPLPYLIELWDARVEDRAERVLARAVSATLARAIFKAAVAEHPNRRVTLRRRGRLIADSRMD